jgi:hypothetical protein
LHNNLDSMLHIYITIIAASSHCNYPPLMSKSCPSLSLPVGSQQPRIRVSQLSPESEDRMDTEASLEGKNASGTDIPSSPEDNNQEALKPIYLQHQLVILTRRDGRLWPHFTPLTPSPRLGDRAYTAGNGWGVQADDSRIWNDLSDSTSGRHGGGFLSACGG